MNSSLPISDYESEGREFESLRARHSFRSKITLESSIVLRQILLPLCGIRISPAGSDARKAAQVRISQGAPFLQSRITLESLTAVPDPSTALRGQDFACRLDYVKDQIEGLFAAGALINRCIDSRPLGQFWRPPTAATLAGTLP